MRTAAAGRHKAESVEDLVDWVRRLPGCPVIARTKQAKCHAESHGDEPATWFYVEADPAEGIARLRCLSGGHILTVADSDQRWTFPPMWSCPTCNHSIAEVAYGVHVANGKARWLVVAVRCVDCGDTGGLTDVVLDRVDLDELILSL